MYLENQSRTLRLLVTTIETDKLESVSVDQCRPIFLKKNKKENR